MSSLTLTLSGDTSRLQTYYYPPIDLTNGVYECGLIDLQTFNSIPNVDSRNNLFHYKIDLLSYIIIIPIGSYEIDDVNKYVSKQLTINHPNKKIKLEISANNNTLKSEVISDFQINFDYENSIGSLLGFAKRCLQGGKAYESDLPVQILRINTLRVECNIIHGAYFNNLQTNTIHEFFPSSPPGYKIVETPKNVIYLPTNTQLIRNLEISIVDQDNNLVDFRGELLTVRVHIRKIKQC